MAPPIQPDGSAKVVCTPPTPSVQVKLKGKASGKPKSVRSPSRESKAALISRGSDFPTTMKLIGSCGKPEKSVPVKGQKVSEPEPKLTVTKGAGLVFVNSPLTLDGGEGEVPKSALL